MSLNGLLLNSILHGGHGWGRSFVLLSSSWRKRKMSEILLEKMLKAPKKNVVDILLHSHNIIKMGYNHHHVYHTYIIQSSSCISHIYHTIIIMYIIHISYNHHHVYHTYIIQSSSCISHIYHTIIIMYKVEGGGIEFRSPHSPL